MGEMYASKAIGGISGSCNPSRRSVCNNSIGTEIEPREHLTQYRPHSSHRLVPHGEATDMSYVLRNGDDTV
jgi:hypothetical protein